MVARIAARRILEKNLIAFQVNLAIPRPIALAGGREWRVGVIENPLCEAHCMGCCAVRDHQWAGTKQGSALVSSTEMYVHCTTLCILRQSLSVSFSGIRPP
jgi:hypothetical protein